MYHSVTNPDLLLQESGHSQGLTHSKPAEYGIRQAILTGPDHPNRKVSLSRGIPVDIHQVAPLSHRPIHNEVQQQVTSVCVTIPDL